MQGYKYSLGVLWSKLETRVRIFSHFKLVLAFLVVPCISCLCFSLEKMRLCANITFYQCTSP